MAQRSELSCERTERTTSVLVDRAAGQRGQNYSHNHQACVGKETEAGPVKTVSESAGEAIRQLGEV